MSENQGHKFLLGKVVATYRVAEDFQAEEIFPLLDRHAVGDWGELDEEDKQTNEQALKNGSRLMSAYTVKGKKIWIITEATRDVTTVLYPEDY